MSQALWVLTMSLMDKVVTAAKVATAAKAAVEAAMEVVVRAVDDSL